MKRTLFTLFALLFSITTFALPAHVDSTQHGRATWVPGVKACKSTHPDFKFCMNCAKLEFTCEKAGYMKGRLYGSGVAGKATWFDCMRPLLLNKKVTGVTVDPALVKTCRTLKINELREELAALQKANGN